MFFETETVEGVINSILFDYFNTEREMNMRGGKDILFIKLSEGSKLKIGTSETNLNALNLRLTYNRGFNKDHAKSLQNLLLRAAYSTGDQIASVYCARPIQNLINKFSYSRKACVWTYSVILTLYITLGAWKASANNCSSTPTKTAHSDDNSTCVAGVAIILLIGLVVTIIVSVIYFIYFAARRNSIKNQSKRLLFNTLKDREESMAEVVQYFNETFLYDEGYELEVGWFGAYLSLDKYTTVRLGSDNRVDTESTFVGLHSARDTQVGSRFAPTVMADTAGLSNQEVLVRGKDDFSYPQGYEAVPA